LGNVQDRATAHKVSQFGHADTTRGLEALERTGTFEGAIGYRLNKHELNATPIPAAWILEGEPVARGKRLSGSTDGMASTYMWDCTAGRFNWFYDVDETVCLLEGSVFVKDAAGEQHRLRAGGTFLFPAGSRFEWTVTNYVRKIAFMHIPQSPKILYAKRVYKALMRLVRPQGMTGTVALSK